MSSGPQLFRITPEDRKSKAVREVDFAQLGLRERQDIQEWIAANPRILDPDLLLIGKEFSGFDRTSERLDLLAVDSDGRLVVIELKRDDTGADAHWQAIKYASYFQRANPDNIIGLLASHEKLAKTEAQQRLLEHLNSDDLNALNNDQRIIIASHRFAPEVTSAAIWLNEKMQGDNVITCIQLTPYQDTDTGSLYVQANTIIPVPGVDELVIGVGETSPGAGSLISHRSRDSSNQHDVVTRFLRRVSQLLVDRLPTELKPDKQSRWAGGYPDRRYFHLWYSRPPWGNWTVAYTVDLVREDEGKQWRSEVGLYCKIDKLHSALKGESIFDDQEINSPWIWVSRTISTLDEANGKMLADTLQHFVEVITPKVSEFEQETNEEDV